ncbi:MAG: type II CAAX endopeptidase family protein [Lachnospiraceae bacterium]|nr:type II CAAX endopeptidase family protein [Lachnospiraceae bacterium]
MPKNPRTVNYFLMIYLIFDLCLSFAGGFLFDTAILSGILQFLPVILGVIYLLLTKQPVFSTIKINKFHPLTIPCIILFTFCLWPFISVVNMFSMLFSDNFISNTVTSTITSNGIIYALITMALLPAIIEEFTFRGIIYGQYRCSRPIKAIILSALCFGLMHMNFNQFCYAFVMGIFLALLVEAAGSLIPSIIMHFTFNSTSILLVYMEQKLDKYLPTAENTQITSQNIMDALPTLLPVTIMGCLLAFLLYRIMAKLNHRENEIHSWRDIQAYRMRPDDKLTNICFYCFVIICLMICVLMEFLN